MLASASSKSIPVGKTLIMGILNVTPDSFSDGGLYATVPSALARAEKMIEEGADIIDVGGESSRPGSEAISVEEELFRVIPVIKELRSRIGSEILISVDTYKSEIAEKALEAGADMINAMGGFAFDGKLAELIRQYKCPLIIYHIQGTPKYMQENPTYGDIVSEIKDFFARQIILCESVGLTRSQIVLDPGIGFGKTLEQNLILINEFDQFSEFSCPILFGVSRKSHLGTLLQQELGMEGTPSVLDRTEAALAETAVAVMNGATIVRTHDVASTKKFVAVLDRVLKSKYVTDTSRDSSERN